jgi:hypothetical protein
MYLFIYLYVYTHIYSCIYFYSAGVELRACTNKNVIRTVRSQASFFLLFAALVVEPRVLSIVDKCSTTEQIAFQRARTNLYRLLYILRDKCIESVISPIWQSRKLRHKSAKTHLRWHSWWEVALQLILLYCCKVSAADTVVHTRLLVNGVDHVGSENSEQVRSMLGSSSEMELGLGFKTA